MQNPKAPAVAIDPKIIDTLDRQQTVVEEALGSIADSLELVALYYRRKGESEGVWHDDDLEPEDTGATPPRS